ncbi:MAG TPA: hypothetical protein EYO33_09820 [Phycisphaerales bacterium]|nr:hypothetical protein [Phycisphaerales bacterium]
MPFPLRNHHDRPSDTSLSENHHIPGAERQQKFPPSELPDDLAADLIQAAECLLRGEKPNYRRSRQSQPAAENDSRLPAQLPRFEYRLLNGPQFDSDKAGLVENPLFRESSILQGIAHVLSLLDDFPSTPNKLLEAELRMCCRRHIQKLLERWDRFKKPRRREEPEAVQAARAVINDKEPPENLIFDDPQKVSNSWEGARSEAQRTEGERFSEIQLPHFGDLDMEHSFFQSQKNPKLRLKLIENAIREVFQKFVLVDTSGSAMATRNMNLYFGFHRILFDELAALVKEWDHYSTLLKSGGGGHE